jgi:hypothetical protein
MVPGLVAVALEAVYDTAIDAEPPAGTMSTDGTTLHDATGSVAVQLGV